MSETASPACCSLFIYGTLRDPRLFRAVAGRSMRHFRPRRARHDGARVLRIDGGVYPILLDGAGVAEGVLLTGLSRESWRRLKFYEEPEYALRPVQVRLWRSKTPIAAHAFWPNSEIRASAEAWDQAEWKKRHRQRAVAAATRYMSYFDREPPEDLDTVWREIVLSLELGHPE